MPDKFRDDICRYCDHYKKGEDCYDGKCTLHGYEGLQDFCPSCENFDKDFE